MKKSALLEGHLGDDVVDDDDDGGVDDGDKNGVDDSDDDGVDDCDDDGVDDREDDDDDDGYDKTTYCRLWGVSKIEKPLPANFTQFVDILDNNRDFLPFWKML